MESSWASAELTIKFNTPVTDNLINLMAEYNPTYNGEKIDNLKEHIENNNKFSIYPAKSNLFICDDDFIKRCKNPIALFAYYKNKIQDGNVPMTLCMNDGKYDVQLLPYSEDTRQSYNILLDRVILDLGSLSKSSISLSPDIFNTLASMNEENNVYSKYLKEFLSILAISDKVVASGDDLNKFEFQIFTQDNVKRFKFDWLDTGLMGNNFWYVCYQWIISDDQRSFDINTKRNIVREGIAKYISNEDVSSFNNVNKSELINIFDNILRIIISGRTHEYFELQKIIKSEYIDIYTKNFETFSNVVNMIIALIIAIAAGIYGIIIGQEGTNNLFEPNTDVSLLLFIMFIAEVFIVISAIVKFVSHNTFLKSLKKINAEKLMISNEDLEYLEPKRKVQIIFVFIALTTIISVTILGIFWFSGLLNNNMSQSTGAFPADFFMRNILE